MSAKRKRQKKKIPQADQADRHRLYELAVQCAEAEVDFVAETFAKLRGRPAQILREDFCGTAAVCCDWVSRDDKHQAVGVDLDPDVLSWGEAHRVAPLSKSQQQRVQLLEANVLDAKSEPADVLLAMNFSYWLFKERAELVNYFRTAHANLVEDGVMFLDAYGGYDSFKEVDEEREIDDDADGFTYIWDQAAFNPITNHLICHIHFAFNDGSVMEEAFTYDWRLYTLPEIRDALHEAGFKKTTVYWQGWDDDGEASGDFYPAEDADADAGWICYISAEK